MVAPPPLLAVARDSHIPTHPCNDLPSMPICQGRPSRGPARYQWFCHFQAHGGAAVPDSIGVAGGAPDVSLRPVGEGEGGEAGGEGTEEEEEEDEDDEDDEDEGKEEAEGAVVGWAAAPPRGGGLCISEEWLRFFADGEKRRRGVPSQ